MGDINKPKIELFPTGDLDDPARMELFEFCDRFSSRHRDRFLSALEKDDTVFTVRGNVTGHLVGFGTLSIIPVEHGGKRATVIYTGWAMISPEFRKHGIIQRVGFNAFLQERLKSPFRRIYWMMTSSTLNSYLLMVRNFVVSYPREGLDWPPLEKAYVQQVLDRMGARWNPDTGVVERGGLSFYREGQVDATARDSSDPDIAFYARTNPSQAQGDTLVCLAPLTAQNFARVTKRRLLGSGRKKAVGSKPESGMKKRAASPYWRMALMTAMAFAIYGGWAFGVNFSNGFPTAITAGLAQGVSSSISTLIISGVIEYCYAKFQGHRMGLLMAWLVPPSLTAFMHAAFQWIVGTPDIFRTILLSVVMGYIFGGLYVRGLIHLKRSLEETGPDNDAEAAVS